MHALKFGHNRVESFKIVFFLLFFARFQKSISPLLCHTFHFHAHLGAVAAIAISDRNDQRKYPFHVERVNTLAKLEYYLMNYHRPNGIARGITAQFRYSCIHALRTYIIDRNRCTQWCTSISYNWKLIRRWPIRDYHYHSLLRKRERERLEKWYDDFPLISRYVFFLNRKLFD